MKFYLLFLIIPLSISVMASQKAVTEKGDVVILGNDGTWVYEDQKTIDTKELNTNPTPFQAPDSANFKLKSNINKSTFAINTEEWKFTKTNPNEDADWEYFFQFKFGDIYAMAITEEMVVPLNALGDAAFKNAQSAGDDFRVVDKEYRIVNGKKVLFMETTGTIDGMVVTYIGYYFSDSTGSTQLIAFTGSNLTEKYEKDIYNFLNGLSSQL